jgi:hypothetical protein
VNALKSALLYFALVFGAGFALALIRIPLLVPHMGVRAAELIEMPFMLMVIYFAARWIVRRMPAPAARTARLVVGVLALGLLLLAEFTLVPWLQGLSVREAIASRDPVSGAAYAMSLVVFALMPLLVARGTHAQTTP